MSSAGLRSPWKKRCRRAVANALGCLAAAAVAFATFGSERAVAATVSASLEIGASIGIRCTIITMPLAFGNYSVTNPVAHDASGGISLNCTPSNFQIRIRIGEGLNPGPGSSNPNPVRRMSDGLGNFLNYNIYRNAARTQIWGGNTPNDLNPPNGPWPMLIPVYGRIPALQNVEPGPYNDTVEVRVQF